MKGLIGIVLAMAVLGLSAFCWRLSSRRRSLPCPVWLRWLVELDNPFTKTNRAAFIVQSLSLVPGMRVVDAGCGPGRLTLPLARAVGTEGSVLAVDIQPGMIRRTKEKVETSGLQQVSFLQAGLGEGQLPKAFFDRAVLVTVLGEIPEQDRALRELYASLKPGAILAVVEVIFDPHFQSQRQVRNLAQAAGFEEQGLFGHAWAYVMHLRKPQQGANQA